MLDEKRSVSLSCHATDSEANPPSLQDIVSALKRSLAQTEGFRQAADEIDPNVTLLESGLDLDSITIVELIARIEAHFEFQFRDTDLRTRSFASLQALAEVVLRRLSDRK